MAKRMLEAWTALESSNFHTEFCVPVAGDTDLTVDIDNATLYSALSESREKVGSQTLYLVFDWVDNQNKIIIYGLGSFSACCRMVDY